MMLRKLAVVATASIVSFSAFAVQKDITVVADIDPTLELLQADGSALPATLRMNYVPGLGLSPQSLQTKIFSNAVTKGVKMRLVNAPVLVSTTTTAADIPLKVSYNTQALSATSDVTLDAADLFPAAAAGNGSVAMPLQIAQATAGIAAAGSYQGVVSIVLTQEP
ncbi:CS1 type fimbrial major subunit [Alcaligenaceae bacterium A4P071]|nr:CS1 type fimbrial major subunit [Alcaligenaceae bacterium A4P071]